MNKELKMLKSQAHELVKIYENALKSEVANIVKYMYVRDCNIDEDDDCYEEFISATDINDKIKVLDEYYGEEDKELTIDLEEPITVTYQNSAYDADGEYETREVEWITIGNDGSLELGDADWEDLPLSEKENVLETLEYQISDDFEPKSKVKCQYDYEYEEDEEKRLKKMQDHFYQLKQCQNENARFFEQLFFKKLHSPLTDR